MAKFTVCIFKREINLHARCFEDVAKALVSALRLLGHEVTDFDNPGRFIMFGVNNVSVDKNNPIPKDAIVFNTEQVVNGVYKQMQGFDYLRGHVIWDYSKLNAAVLKESGAERVVHCPIGYEASMVKIPQVDKKHIDVLHYGAMSERRKEVLNALNNAGLWVGNLFGVYGEERDSVIARAKVVVNLHYYKKPIFEIFRVSHLLANGICVVSEDGGCDADLEDLARRITVYCSREEIVSKCKDLVVNEALRLDAAERGRQEFMKTSFVENVRRALEQS